MKKMLAAVLTIVFLCATLSSGAFATEDLKEARNDTVLTLTVLYQMIIEEMWLEENPDLDYFYAIGSVKYSPNVYRTTNDGVRIVDGGISSVYGTFSTGAGYGIDDGSEDYWYLTLTFDQDNDVEMMLYNLMSLIMALNQIGMPLGSDEEEMAAYGSKIASSLLSGDPIAMEIGDFVLFRKNIEDNRFIIGVNSLPLYNGLYAGTITPYYHLTF